MNKHIELTKKDKYLFTCDGGKNQFYGYIINDDKWNGFEVPYFTRDELIKIEKSWHDDNNAPKIKFGKRVIKFAYEKYKIASHMEFNTIKGIDTKKSNGVYFVYEKIYPLNGLCWKKIEMDEVVIRLKSKSGRGKISHFGLEANK
tara:strand:+ start:2169 stop:2603 length:435 start_codon:yes stop_codon:yes gene_type:complete